jgi:hypothetical protein
MNTQIPAQPLMTQTAAPADQRELTFTDRVKFLVQLNRALIYLISEVSKLPKGGRYQFTRSDTGQPIEIGRVELKKYSSALNSKFEHLGKDFNQSRRKKVRKTKVNADGTTGVTNKLAQPAFISDQLKNFFIEMIQSASETGITFTRYQDLKTFNKNGKETIKRTPMLGANNAAIQEVFTIQDLTVLATNNISVAAVNTELFTLCTYIYASKSQTNGTRFHVTDLMEKYFGAGTNCRWTINGGELPYTSATAELSNEELAAYGIPSEKMNKFREDVAGLDKSALDRIYERNTEPISDGNGGYVMDPTTGQPQLSYPYKKNGTQYIPYIRPEQVAAIHSAYPQLCYGDDDHGIVFAMFMVLATYFRIPTYAIDKTSAVALSQTEVIAQLNTLQSKLKDTIQTYRDFTGGAKKTKAKPKQARKPRADLLQQWVGAVPTSGTTTQ